MPRSQTSKDLIAAATLLREKGRARYSLSSNSRHSVARACSDATRPFVIRTLDCHRAVRLLLAEHGLRLSEMENSILTSPEQAEALLCEAAEACK